MRDESDTDSHVVSLVQVLSTTNVETGIKGPNQPRPDLSHPDPSRTCRSSFLSATMTTGTTTTYLDLPDTQVQKGQPVPDLDDALGSLTTHRGPQSTVQPQDDELVEHRRVQRV